MSKRKHREKTDEQQAFERGMRRAAEIAELFADENMRMADDTIRLDPILNREKRALITSPDQFTQAAKVSEDLEYDGFMYASRSHAAKDIAEAIREEIA